MHGDILQACLPWLGILLGTVVFLWLLLKLAGSRSQWRRLLQLHRDEGGGVQSLAFVLTVPIFVMVVLLIVQVSQLMIGIALVHYSAYAAARSAIVWIPADTGGDEGENRISDRFLDDNAGIPSDDENDKTYTIRPGSAKYRKIELAAAMACMPIAPSRDLGYRIGGETVASLQNIYRSLDPNYEMNARIAKRLENKLAYCLEHSRIKISFLHRDVDPPLQRWDVPPDRDEFYDNEVGWQDAIKVTVTHRFALLPGMGRILGRSTNSLSRSDRVSQSIDRIEGVYVRELTASCTLGNEGRKSAMPFQHRLSE